MVLPSNTGSRSAHLNTIFNRIRQAATDIKTRSQNIRGAALAGTLTYADAYDYLRFLNAAHQTLDRLSPAASDPNLRQYAQNELPGYTDNIDLDIDATQVELIAVRNDLARTLPADNPSGQTISAGDTQDTTPPVATWNSLTPLLDSLLATID